MTQGAVDQLLGKEPRTFRVTLRPDDGVPRDVTMGMAEARQYIRNHFPVVQLTGEPVLGVPYEGVSHA